MKINNRVLINLREEELDKFLDDSPGIVLPIPDYLPEGTIVHVLEQINNEYCMKCYTGKRFPVKLYPSKEVIAVSEALIFPKFSNTICAYNILLERSSGNLLGRAFLELPFQQEPWEV